METQCPNCNQLYDVDDEALGQIVECPECKKEFLVESNNSTSNVKKAKRSIPKKFIAVVSIALLLLIGCFSAYYIYSLRPSASRAVDNRANVSYLLLGAKFKMALSQQMVDF